MQIWGYFYKEKFLWWPGHLPSLIRVFAVRIKKHWALNYLLNAHWRLIRLGQCPGWSESSLGAHVILLVLSCSSSNIVDPIQTSPSLIRVYIVCHSICIFWMQYPLSMLEKIALQALHDTTPLCLFLLLRMFCHEKKYQCIYQILSNPPIISQDIKHKHNSKINQGSYSVERFRKIMCISLNMDHIYQCINKILSKFIHYF